MVVEAEYDVPPAAWYFAENGYPTMPFCVLLEAHLQPCGWLALAAGVPRVTEEGLFFRNLDGQGTLLCEIPPKAARLSTQTRLTDVSGSGGMYLVSFEVEGRLQDQLVFRMTTGFGFFPQAALAKQVGLPQGEDESGWSPEGTAAFDLDGLLARSDIPHPPLAAQRLRMLDRVTGYWPLAGPAGLGRLRAEKDVSPSQWFFKAHFYQDPVQPGSLGLEAMIQLLQVYMLERGLDRGIPSPRFEPLALDHPLTWKYRGQVLPTHRRVTIELEVLEAGRDERGAFALADAWLWVDGTRIYGAHRLGMRIVPGASAAVTPVTPP
jgi:3-hydroxymyristoyl/3-hydroxydecanoyl-(acyl carrier protein) dehydratase